MTEKKPFEQVYDENYNRIYRYAFSILLNKRNAEDIVSDTFFSAFSEYESYDPEKSSVATWLLRIAHNKAVNLCRSREYSNVPLSEEILESSFASQTDMEKQAHANATVFWLYKKLLPEERELLDFRYGQGLKDKEVASLYSISEKAVNKRYQRLLKKCRKILDGEKSGK